MITSARHREHMGRAATAAAAWACLLVALAGACGAAAGTLQTERHSRWERVLQGGAGAMMAANAPAPPPAAALGLPAQVPSYACNHCHSKKSV